jgi:hypothetical protein
MKSKEAHLENLMLKTSLNFEHGSGNRTAFEMIYEMMSFEEQKELRCDTCCRIGDTSTKIGDICGMLQPNDVRCKGKFK